MPTGRTPNFVDLQDLERKILTFIDEWNEQAAPFNWTEKSFEKTLAKVDATPLCQGSCRLVVC